MISRKYPADFRQLEKVLCRQKPDRPVLFEFFMHDGLVSFINEEPFELLSSPADQIKSLIRFFYKTGYDYATIPARYFGILPFENAGHQKKETVSLNDGSVITDRNSFENYRWPNYEQGDFALLTRVAKELRDGMKFVISGPGGVLENAIELVGYQNLCFMVFEDEELTKAIFDEVGSRLLRFYEQFSKPDEVGALIVNDDWGFKHQTMLSPEMLRQYVFPWHKRMVEAIHKSGKFAILHSCGNLREVNDDIIQEMKFDAKHSYEDIIIPVEQAWKIWHERIAILGGIDLDFLTRSKPDEISKRCRNMLDLTGSVSYALGSGNSIPHYVPAKNYLAMIGAIHE